MPAQRSLLVTCLSHRHGACSGMRAGETWNDAGISRVDQRRVLAFLTGVHAQEDGANMGESKEQNRGVGPAKGAEGGTVHMRVGLDTWAEGGCACLRTG